MRYARKIRRYAKRILREVKDVEECIEFRQTDEDEMYEDSGCSC